MKRDDVLRCQKVMESALKLRGAVLEQQAMHRVHASYQAVHAQIESSMRKGSLSETATKLREQASTVDIDFSKPLPLLHDQKHANEVSLLQMTKRIDENAFRIVDFAAVYIESRSSRLARSFSSFFSVIFIESST